MPSAFPHLRPLVVTALAAAGTPVWASCPATSASVEAHANAALAAFAQARSASFAGEREELRAELGCVTDVPSPQQAALVYEVDALHWFYVKEKERSILSFQAMAAADPALPLDPAAAPPGGPVDFWRSEALLRPPLPSGPVSLDPSLVLTVDGARGEAVPVGRPAWVVVSEADGRVLWSGLVQSPADVPAIEPDRLSTRLAKPALVGAGVSAALSAGLWGLALRDRAAVDALSAGIQANEGEAELGMSWEEARALVRRSNTLGYAAQATTGVAIGLGVVGLVWTW